MPECTLRMHISTGNGLEVPPPEHKRDQPAYDEMATTTGNDLGELQRHLALVQTSDHHNPGTAGSNRRSVLSSATITTPLFTSKVKCRLPSLEDKPVFPVYGPLGLRLATYKDGVETEDVQQDDKLIYANVNAPWSAFICGSQGAGKSHTLSCLLENALFSDGMLGPNPNPLAGIVFHYDKHSGQTAAQTCEAAYLASNGIEVEVFVSPSNQWAMQRLYHLPGIPANKQPVVRPLLLHDKQINIGNMRTLMNLDAQDGKIPLYMALVNKILKQMAIQREGAPGIDYPQFKKELNKAKLSPTQIEHLDMRLQLLESFLHRTATKKFKQLAGDGFKPKAGSLTNVDLSCPFVSESDACTLFSICLSLFLGSRSDHGLIVALDEAHKFLTETTEAKSFTEDLIQVARQQCHLATRVIIATQEPILSPALLDLCNVTIVHRFQSQAWYNTLKNHLAALSTRSEGDDVFSRIVDLENGEAMVFCPTACLDVEGGGAEGEGEAVAVVKALKSGYVKMSVRRRVTTDGGQSIMVARSGEE